MGAQPNPHVKTTAIQETSCAQLRGLQPDLKSAPSRMCPSRYISAHNEIHARLIADRFTFLSLGEVIGAGLSSELGGDDVKRLMAGGAQIGDLAKELEAV